ncbi:MAG: transposase [Anaerovoracaceae bacterium]
MRRSLRWFCYVLLPSLRRLQNRPVQMPFPFCNTCGVAYQSQPRSYLPNSLTVTIAISSSQLLKNFAGIFKKDRRLLDVLFQSAAQTISDWLYEQNHSRNFKAGMICGLHTFGRDLKWNPHIHMIITEGALDCNEKWKNIRFFPYTMLRSRFMTTLLFNMKSALVPSLFLFDFKALTNRLYKTKNNGFYVNAPPAKLGSAEAIVNYVIRYIGRPVMAHKSRITSYDGTDVTYWYQRHEDNEKITVTESACEFIKKLIIHIPEKNFRARYYGLYAKGPSAPILILSGGFLNPLGKSAEHCLMAVCS